MKLNKKLIAIPAIALAAGIGLTACSSGGAPQSSTQTPATQASSQALVPGTATNSQICHAAVGTSGKGLTVESDTPATAYSSPEGIPASGVASCIATMSNGVPEPMAVTLFANGSVGWHTDN